MKKIFKYSFLIFIFSFIFFELSSCKAKGVKSTKPETIPETTEDNNSIAEITSSDILFDGLDGTIVVSNNTLSIDFNDIITVPQGASWVLLKDLSGEAISTKIAPLSEGNNMFNVIVTSPDETNSKTYNIKVRRKELYTVSFDTDGAGEMTPQIIEEGISIMPIAPSKVGYTFDGWYINDNKIELPYTVSVNVELEAKFTANKYVVTVNAQGYDYIGADTYEVTYGESFEFPVASGTPSDKQYTVIDGVFNGWKYNDELITDDSGVLLDEWTTASNITITPDITFDSVYYGSYPQSVVEANEDNGLSSISFDASVWTDYGYYMNESESGFMYYIDIDADNNNSFDYRGVYFTKYRPYNENLNGQESTSYQVNNEYYPNNIYWFKYEPIKWNILDKKDGKAMIISDLVLDAKEYQSYTTPGVEFTHNGGSGYANNYALSNIRKWINDTFYETAFNDLEKLIINITEVDNSVSSVYSSDNIYVCDNTFDKMFLLSYQENRKYYPDNSVYTTTTEYAKSQGVLVSTNTKTLGGSYWWLRSPRNNHDCMAWYFTSSPTNTYAYYNYIGARPVCWINL